MFSSCKLRAVSPIYQAHAFQFLFVLCLLPALCHQLFARSFLPTRAAFIVLHCLFELFCTVCSSLHEISVLGHDCHYSELNIYMICDIQTGVELIYELNFDSIAVRYVRSVKRGLIRVLLRKQIGFKWARTGENVTSISQVCSWFCSKVLLACEAII